MLQEAREKWTAAGRRPEISVGRVNGQVLLIDGSQPEVAGFVATVVFRSRELRTWAPLGEKSSAASSSSSSAASRLLLMLMMLTTTARSRPSSL